MTLTREKQISQACALIGITRITIRPDHPDLAGISREMKEGIRGREMWMLPNDEPLGFLTPEEGLAKLRWAVAQVERNRATLQ